VNSEGLSREDISTTFPGQLGEGSSGEGVRTVQYFLDYISLFVPTVNGLAVDGSYGAATAEAVKSFQKTYGLEETGTVDRATWERIESVYFGIISELDFRYRPGQILPFPGRVLRVGVQGDDVRAMQGYLNYIARTYSQIPTVAEDGDFGTATAEQVRRFKEIFGLPGAPERVSAPTWSAITSVYDDLYGEGTVNDGQYQGYELG
jgi:peptidoglycan hydrolase-like protein with peptidoglycan-binding domain